MEIDHRGTLAAKEKLLISAYPNYIPRNEWLERLFCLKYRLA